MTTPSPDLTAEQTTPPTWWSQYFHPIPNPRSPWSQIPARLPTSAYLLPLIILLATVFGCLFWIYSSEAYFERVSAKALERASSTEQRAAFERTVEMTRRVTQNPVFRAWVSLESLWVVVRSLLLLHFVGWILLSSITGNWSEFLPFTFSVFVSTGVIVIGMIVYAAFRLFLGMEWFFLSPLLFIDSFDPSDPLHLLSARVDLFLLWFLAAVSVRSSHIYRERVPIVFAALFGLWLILFSLFFLLERSFYILP